MDQVEDDVTSGGEVDGRIGVERMTLLLVQVLVLVQLVQLLEWCCRVLVQLLGAA